MREVVLQYKLYCDMQEQEARLLVSQGRQLCCYTRLGAGQARDTSAGGRVGGAGGSGGRTGGRAGRTGGRAGRTGGHAGRRRAACAHLGVLLGCGRCTWCTQPIFDPV